MKRALILLLTFVFIIPLTVSAGDNSHNLLCETAFKSPGSSHSDWSAIALSVSGEYFDKSTYLDTLGYYILSKYQTEEKLSRNKATEWHRLIIAVNLVGGNAENVYGINLINDGIFSKENLGRQGINGYIWALIALNSGDFYKRADCINTEASILSEILNRQNSDGGFSLSGNESSCDITAMTLYALSFYRNDKVVNNAIVNAVSFLKGIQNIDGTFSEAGVINAESTAQVMIALKAFGDTYYNDFIDLYNALQLFKTDNGFSHVIGGDTDIMATYQSVCALSAFEQNQPVYSFQHNNQETVETAEIQTEVVYITESVTEHSTEPIDVPKEAETSEPTEQNFQIVQAPLSVELPTEDTEIITAETNKLPENLESILFICAIVAFVAISVIIIRRKAWKL